MPLAGTRLTPGQIKSLWIAAGGPEHEAVDMTAIALAESSGYTGAWNPGRGGAGGTNSHEYSVGIWQINTYAHRNYTVEQLKDPNINAREAVRIYRLQGKKAWGAWTDKRYRQYLTAAGAPAAGGSIVAANYSPTPGGPSSPGNDGELILYGMAFVLLILLLDG